ncbi:MAG: GspE/PulE family protein [Candidatus Omnitrophota bacterium]
MAHYTEINLKEQKLDPQVVMMISENIARKHKIIPVKLDKNDLFVAMTDAENLPLIDELKLLTGCVIKPVKAEEKDVAQAISHYYKVEEGSRQALIDMRVDRLKEVGKKKASAMLLEEEIYKLEDLPVVKLVNSIFNGGINSKGSDIHLEPQDPEMVVRYRVDGILHDIMTIPKHIEKQLVSRIKVLSNMDITERRKPQDGHILLNKDDKEYDLRVSTMPTIGGETVVMRIFDKSSMLISLEKLGFTGEDENKFRELIKKPYGMVLVTGPTGCGKTTTLYAILRQLNSEERNIITIENPVEYKLNKINQVQVDEGANMTFATGLRTILRQDPDIIMVGEIRDKETAEIAIQAALTGHLVFSTLHTNDAASAVTRLVDMGVEPFLIASTVIGCLAQRLCRVICPECRGKGCNMCYDTGYKGRIGIYELLAVSENIQNLILNRKSAVEIKHAAVTEGMKTLEDNGNKKVQDGVTTVEEVERVIYLEG